MNVLRKLSLTPSEQGAGDASSSRPPTPPKSPSSVNSVASSKCGLDPIGEAKAYNTMASAAVDLSDPMVCNGVFSVIRSVRDIDQGKRRKYLYTIPVPQGAGFFPFSIPPSEVPDDIQARVPSPSGDKIAILREETAASVMQDNGNEKKTKQVLEVWTNDCQALSKRIVLPSSQHGKVVNDPNWFGQIAWSEDEHSLVYSAERKSPETTHFFDTAEEDTKIRGAEFTLGLGVAETWGEKYTDFSGRLDLFVVNAETGNVGRVENIPGDVEDTTTEGGYALGQASFSPCGTHVVYTAWDAGGGEEMPRRLGMAHCVQRPCKIYASPVKALLARISNQESTGEKDGELVCLTPSPRLSRSPRFSPTKSGLSRLLFLSSKFGFDTHNGGVSLHVIDWNVVDCKPMLDSRHVWVDTVLTPAPRDSNNDVLISNMGFPGLYTNQLALGCCTRDYLFVTTQWGSVQKIVRISLSDGSLSLFNVDIIRANGDSSESFASQAILCVTLDGGVIVSECAPNQPAIVGHVAPQAVSRESVSKKVEGMLIAQMPPIASTCFSGVPTTGLSRVLGFSYDVLTMRPPQIEDSVDTPNQWILLLPKTESNEEGRNPPLIIVPHGGPHTCTSTIYAPSYAYLCGHGGYAILHVNYRGSTGFGQGNLEQLPGNVGLLDVKDIVHAAITLADTGWVDRDRIGICGGSHGGFLAAHCIGQFPDLFKVAALRNPVTNIASMVTATDIPDWCYVEALGCGCYSWKEFRGVHKEEMAAMWDASPIRYAQKVVAPTLVALGMKDQRVPPSQGLEFYHILRANGVKTKLLKYDKDDHAIDNVKSEADHWINIKIWFDENLKSISGSASK